MNEFQIYEEAVFHMNSGLSRIIDMVLCLISTTVTFHHQTTTILKHRVGWLVRLKSIPCCSCFWIISNIISYLYPILVSIQTSLHFHF